MPRPLDDIRTEIDQLDEMLVYSFFDGFSPNKNPGETAIKQDEVNQLLFTGLRFSTMTWQLINARMELSKEVIQAKKKEGISDVVNTTRKQQVISNAQSHAPEHAREQVRKLYEIIHDISVRIQNRVIETL